MTFFLVVFFGAGILFVTSAIENISLKDTFTGIISGQPLTNKTSTSASKPTTQTF